MIVDRLQHAFRGVISPCVSTLVLASIVLAPIVLSHPGRSSSATAQDAIAGAEAKDETLREQTIYIPYQKLREIFEKEGRGVFLPYDKFQELWRAARESQTKPGKSQPPVGALITEIENEAVVERDVVTVTAKVRIDVISQGWQAVPLRLQDAAIRSAKIGDQAARITFDPMAGYRLHVENKGDQPQTIELQLVYAKAFTKAPGRNSVSFQAPAAPVNRWRVRVPQTGVKVDIQPLIAATEAPANVPEKKADGQEPPKEPPQPEETVILAFVGAAPEVRLDWTPKSEGAMGLEALANVQSQQEMTVEDGSIRSRTRLTYSISRSELTQLVLEVPAEFKVTGVFDPNVKNWTPEALPPGPEPSQSLQKITVQLFEPARTTQTLVVELEKLAEDLLKEKIVVPVVRAVGAGRQQGILVVGLGEELRAEVSERRGVMQLDAAELPQPLAGGAWAFSFRFAAVPYDLAIRVEKIRPLVRADELVEAFIDPNQITLDCFAVYEIERAGLFELALTLPAGYELRSVRGREGPNAPAAVVESFHVEGEKKDRLVVSLARKAIGRIGLFVELQKRLDDPNLLSPTGQKSNLELVLPRVAADSVERSSGKFVVYSPESLLLNPSQTEGLTTVSFQEALQPIPSTRDGRFGGSREVLAYSFSQPPSALTLAVERRRHQITARQLLIARVEAGVIRYESTIFYEILYSGVKSLRLDVPQELATKINLRASGIRKELIEPAPMDVAEGSVAWNLAGENEFLGNLAVPFVWEESVKELDVGKSVTFTIPTLQPKLVDRSWGQIVVTKAETLDVLPAPDHSGLRPIDPQQDVMAEAKVPDAALAFEYHDQWKLGITATRYELEDVKRTSIERTVLRAISTLSDQVSMQALYQIRSAQQRIMVKLPTAVTLDIDPFRINGRPVPLERGADGTYLVPLIGQNPDRPFLLEVRYTANGSSFLDFPVFPGAAEGENATATQKVYLCSYLPEESVLVGSRGPWEDEISSEWFARFGATPAPRHSDIELVQWVRDGIETVSDPFQSFPTQGRLSVFSTLRPDPPPKGALRLVAFPRHWLRVTVFGSLIAIGLLFAVASLRIKTSVLGAVLIGLLAVGIFLPALAIQLLNGELFLGIGVLAVTWLVLSIPWRRLPGIGPTHRSESGSPAAAAPNSPFASQPTPVTSQPAPVDGGAGSPASTSSSSATDHADSGRPDSGRSDAGRPDSGQAEGGQDHA